MHHPATNRTEPEKAPTSNLDHGRNIASSRTAMSRINRYVNSEISWFSPVESSSGVLKPPTIEYTASSSESRSHDIVPLKAVTSIIAANATDEGTKWKSEYAAQSER